MNLSGQVGLEEPSIQAKNPHPQPVAKPAITAYLRQHVEKFCYLEELRAKVKFPSAKLILVVTTDL